MPYDALTAELACQALTKASLQFTPAQVRVEARDDRWVVQLPEWRLAWFAASNDGLRRLKTERRVLRLLETRCTFGFPRVLFEDADGDFDVRTMVPGTSDPWRLYAEVCGNAELATRIGTAIGTILAQQHTRIRAADVADWLPHRPGWPESRVWVGERLASVVNDRELIANADAVMRAYEEVPVVDADCALVHTDVGLHNLGIDPDSYAVHGLFDYEGAAWADRHHDFRYLLFDVECDDVLDAALAVYEPVVGYEIQRERLLLYNAACAITFLAHRIGTLPEDRSCGRNLEQDLRWSRFAIARVLDSKTLPNRPLQRT